MGNDNIRLASALWIGLAPFAAVLQNRVAVSIGLIAAGAVLIAYRA